MQKLGLGITAAITQPSSRPSRVFSIPQPPVTTLPPPPTRTFISALTANTIQVASTTNPEFNGTYIVGQAPESGVNYYFIRDPEQDLYFWYPGGSNWVLDSLITNVYVANTIKGDAAGVSYELPTDGWRSDANDQPIDFTFTVLN